MSLLWSPALALERVASRLVERRRLKWLQGTPAEGLAVGHIESLELLRLAAEVGVQVIYDIGAHVGSWTLLAKAVIPTATVEAFEPLREHCESFDASVAGLDKVRLHCVALGRAAGVTPLFVTTRSDSSSFLEPTSAGFDHGVRRLRSVSTVVHRLDDYCAENGLAPPDLLKLDVQGFELEVLEGGVSSIQNAKALIVEVSFVAYYSNQCLFSDVCAFLHNNGFELRALGISTALGKPLTQADALFLKA
jgi:FkbM family methyltransferase